MDLGLDGRAAIITGASRGIGLAIARGLTAEGCRVLICGRDPDALAAAVAAVGDGSVPMDVEITDPAAAEAIVAAAQRAFGRLDIVVNNAGAAVPKALAEVTDADWRESMELNFFAAARLSVAALPTLRAAGWGRLVHVASTSGREPNPLFAPYAAAKAALLNMSTSLSKAFAADGVLSSCVVPGITLTELVEANAIASAERSGSTPEAVMAKMLAQQGVAAGRFGTPDEVAAAVVFLCSQQAAWITGATLEVDGGTLRSV
jgi:NAD(P)-dependent dehydrogenase (short-subunit alcohol dehydrogenase family)